MKKLIPLAATLLLLTAACESKTETVTDDTVTTSTTEVTATVPEVDTAAINDSAANATAATTEAANDAAHATGTAMETAGQKIQEKTDTTNTR